MPAGGERPISAPGKQRLTDLDAGNPTRRVSVRQVPALFNPLEDNGLLPKLDGLRNVEGRF